MKATELSAQKAAASTASTADDTSLMFRIWGEAAGVVAAAD